MPKLQVITTNFTGGESSPRLRGRVDLERYNSSAELLENCVVLRQGGVTIRPSRDYKGEIKSSAQTGRIVPFVYSRTDAYLLEFGNLVMRVWKNGALVESSPSVPLEVVTPWSASQLATIDYTQGADTMIVTHPAVPTQRIRRFSDSQWECLAAPFVPPALAEVGYRSATISMSISSGSVGTGRTLTASAGFFLAAYVGQQMKWGTGSATIQSIGGTTTATVTVTSAFDVTAAAAGVWLLEGTPVTPCLPSLAAPVGVTMTLTLSADGWAAGDVGKFVEINGGLCEITSLDGVSPATIANAIVRSELVGVSSAPAESWALLGPVWNVYDGYPSTCSFYQQRLWLGGTTRYPQAKWGSRTALFFDFTPGTADDAAIYKTIDSDDINVIQYLVSSSGPLVTLTYGGEFDTRGGVEKPVTQLNAQIMMRSRWGCEQVRPEQVGRDLIFVQRGGKALRALFRGQVDDTQTRDISVFSEHMLSGGVKWMSWEQTPEQVLWVGTTAGELLAVTYSDEQSTVAFCSGSAEGVVEWGATIPEGAADATYCLTRYTVNGATKRYVERINWDAPPGQDCRKEATGPASVFPGFTHLEGKTVAVLADDIYVGTAVVTGGEVTISRSAASISAGLAYTATARLPAPEVGTGSGTAQAQAMSTNRVAVRFLATVGCNVNGQPLAFRRMDLSETLDQPVSEFSGIKDVTEYGWQDGESPLELTQDQPYPWTVLSVVRTITVNAG